MFTGNPSAELWIRQFDAGPQQDLARRLLSRFKLVRFDELSSRILTELRTYPSHEHIALFIEREIPRRWVTQSLSVVTWGFRPSKYRAGTRLVRSRKLVPLRMYKEKQVSRGRGIAKKFRATGAALPPVDAPRRDRQEIGSEGVLATIASTAAKSRRNVHVHPSAKVVRDNRIRRFVVLTDFIGSGTRINSILDSLWRVRSVRSWWSGRLIRFSVLAYSGTDQGVKHVRTHPCSPEVNVLVECPTLGASFDAAMSHTLTELCISKASRSEHPLGYGDVGALIAFQHSCPNNVPAIFIESHTSRRNPWQALFPNRSTEAVYENAPHLDRRARDHLALETLGLPLVGHKPRFLRANEASRNLILVLAALRRRHRAPDELATTTLLNLHEIFLAIELGQEEGYLDQTLRLSQDGFALLRRLIRSPKSTKLASEKSVYYPKSLRVPV